MARSSAREHRLSLRLATFSSLPKNTFTSARALLSKPRFPVRAIYGGYLRMMIDARARGFEVVLVYIGTENVELNLARIRDRVLAGGHNVPDKDVRRRYTRSFKNLPTAVQPADHTIIQLTRATGWSRFSARPEISGSNPYRIGPPCSYSPVSVADHKELFHSACCDVQP
jgi:hypothetical protein